MFKLSSTFQINEYFIQDWRHEAQHHREVLSVRHRARLRSSQASGGLRVLGQQKAGAGQGGASACSSQQARGPRQEGPDRQEI